MTFGSFPVFFPVSFPPSYRGRGNRGKPRRLPFRDISGIAGNIHATDEAAHWHWIVELPDRVIETYHHPDKTRAEILQQYPDAVDLEPFPQQPNPTTAPQAAGFSDPWAEGEVHEQ